jgi:hypothetical protein
MNARTNPPTGTIREMISFVRIRNINVCSCGKIIAKEAFRIELMGFVPMSWVIIDSPGGLISIFSHNYKLCRLTTSSKRQRFLLE